ncbi:MAG: class I SAM-dependent methyltransferase [Polyangiaceae bacterium]
MSTDDDADVPYGEDFHDPATAAAWAEGVLRKRPWRTTIFDHFVAVVNGAGPTTLRVLELGSGPGFLAEQLLSRCPHIARYTLLDFSEPMLAQSRERLGDHAPRTQFVQASFKSDGWAARVSGPFDFIVSLQAVHELRHKRHAPRLYAELPALLAAHGEFLVCDHLPEGAHTPRHRVLYMSVAENLAALAGAGLHRPELLWSEHNMALYRASAS